MHAPAYKATKISRPINRDAALDLIFWGKYPTRRWTQPSGDDYNGFIKWTNDARSCWHNRFEGAQYYRLSPKENV